MAVPKKRTGHSAQGKRRSNWKATKPTTTKCPNCGSVMLTHTVCTACGQYKGKVVSRKAEGFVEEAKVETKKAPKKSTKKAAATSDNVEAAQVEAVEEVKAEVVEEVKETEAAEASVEEAKTEETVVEKTEE